MSTSGSREIILLSDALRLVPVLELIVSDSIREEYLPSRETPWNLDGRPDWERDLTQLGLVPLSRLTAPHVLRDLLRNSLESVLAGGKVEQSMEALLGGQALLEGEQLVLAPRCCCALDSLAGWNAAADQTGGLFDIGHPDVRSGWKEPWLLLYEDEADDDFPGQREGLHEWRLAPRALQRAVNAARQEQQAFAHRLEPFLAELFPSGNVRSIASTLAGLD